MPRKQARYSASLVSEWVLLTPSVEDDSLPNETVIEEDQAHRSDTHHITGPPRAYSTADKIRTANRYKKTLPSSWIEDASTQISQRQEQPSRDSDGCDSDNGGRGIRRSNWRADSIDTSISKRGNSGYNTPPAPDSERLHFPYQRVEPAKWSSPGVFPGLADGQVQGQSYRGSAEQGSQDAVQRSNFQDQRAPRFPMNHHGTHYSTISPPMSVDQQSSEATTSPFHGRDLPAKGPSLSPTYSVI